MGERIRAGVEPDVGDHDANSILRSRSGDLFQPCFQPANNVGATLRPHAQNLADDLVMRPASADGPERSAVVIEGH